MLVHNKGKYIRHAAGVMLIPGANQVEVGEWKQFSANHIIKKIIETGEIIVHEESRGFKDLGANDAIELVKDTFDPALLEGWKEKEKRSTVKAAIDEQLALLKGEGDKDPKD